MRFTAVFFFFFPWPSGIGNYKHRILCHTKVLPPFPWYEGETKLLGAVSLHLPVFMLLFVPDQQLPIQSREGQERKINRILPETGEASKGVAAAVETLQSDTFSFVRMVPIILYVKRMIFHSNHVTTSHVLNENRTKQNKSIPSLPPSDRLSDHHFNPKYGKHCLMAHDHDC